MAQKKVKNGGTEYAVTQCAQLTGGIFYLLIEEPKADDAIDFYKEVYGAAELKRFTYPKRKAEQEHVYIYRAALKIGSSIIIVSDDVNDSGESFKVKIGADRAVWLETKDAEATVAKAVEAGAEVAEGLKLGPPLDPKERFAAVRDPFGIIWYIFSYATEKAGAETEAPTTA